VKGQPYTCEMQQVTWWAVRAGWAFHSFGIMRQHCHRGQRWRCGSRGGERVRVWKVH